eukprot:CAMPEP_0195514846 /NCGR_PEP_ID=MMETSP0794_2-20130614/6107_1 /TAXON_ID=515487 /ORGANISM="Stephanopyxis turris, Strain CCMP 815" /LENGTH=1250 /DNA_ID=CAMNT_0040643175 /DNA_START=113 /DNA_END=3865 /DNA_ORIENTATION=-
MNFTQQRNSETENDSQQMKLLSRSLGEVGGHFSEGRTYRRSSSVQSISHRGYLMKRSNHPIKYTSSIGFMTPSAVTNAVLNPDTEYSMCNNKKEEKEEISVTVTEGGSSSDQAVEPSDAFSLPKQPLHVKEVEHGSSQYHGNGETAQMDKKVTIGTSPEIRNTVSFAAAFFGMDDVSLEDHEMSSYSPKETSNFFVDGTSSAPPVTAPIAMSQGFGSQHYDVNRTTASRDKTMNERGIHITKDGQELLTSNLSSSPYHRCDSAPPYVGAENNNNGRFTNHNNLAPPPNEFVDPKDGHVWRAKYCVLEEGVLYFYRNAADADSSEAEEERKSNNFPPPPSSHSKLSPQPQGLSQYAGTGSSIESLSKSPLPRRLALKISPSSSSRGTAGIPSSPHSFEKNVGVVWEKRVSLDNVGAVRSTEEEFGKFSFGLLTADEDSNDCLLLRTSSTQEMNEWLFQFHRSLASFMRQIVGSVGSLHQNPASRGLAPESSLMPPVSYDVPVGVGPFPPPKTGRNSPNLAVSLSHGHGRNGIHRRQTRLCHNQKLTLSASCSFATLDQDSPTQDHSLNGDHEDHDVPFLISTAMPDQKGRENLTSSSIVGKGDNDTDVSPCLSPQHGGGMPLMPNLVLSFDDTTPSVNNSDIGSLAAAVSQLPKAEEAPPAVQTTSTTIKPSTGNKYIPPQLRNEKTGGGGKYIPPWKRKQMSNPAENVTAVVPNTAAVDSVSSGGVFDMCMEDNIHKSPSQNSINTVQAQATTAIDYRSTFKLGGCADPSISRGSILDPANKTNNKIGKHPTIPFGCQPLDVALNTTTNNLLRWEVGAVSECGIRNSNEDSFVIAIDFCAACNNSKSSSHTNSEKIENAAQVGLFAIFDGHCGSQAARFAAEKFPFHLEEALQTVILGKEASSKDTTEDMEPTSSMDLSKVSVDQWKEALFAAIATNDEEFCNLCKMDDRFWESGATALIALMTNTHLLVANLGDCRGVICASAKSNSEKKQPCDINSEVQTGGWVPLVEDEEQGGWDINSGKDTHCVYKEVTNIHNPSREDEKRRIEAARGWITTESEVCIGQLQRLDLYDEDVVDILKRCFSDRLENEKRQNSVEPGRLLHISRVCGELAVSRALGDRDFKEAYNPSCDAACYKGGEKIEQLWQGPNFLPYPDLHNTCFKGDLVSAVPEIQGHVIGKEGMSDEFLLLACDGLWDVMDLEDAVRVTRGLLFEKNWTTKKAAARLSEIAMHLGSSDNITVVLVRFCRGEE